MKQKPIFQWIVANALGLGVAFNAMLFLGGWILSFFISETPSKEPDIPTAALWDLAYTTIAWGIGGVVLGFAQGLVLRNHEVSKGKWILRSAIGFCVAALLLACPLQAMELLGRIPGPVEPILFSVGGCSGAGVFQWLLLRRQGIQTGKWLPLWIVGLVVSILPTALMFLLLQGPLGMSIPWSIEVFLQGVMCAGVAAWISGNALFAALAKKPGTTTDIDTSV
jgi:hypothetical protein